MLIPGCHNSPHLSDLFLISIPHCSLLLLLSLPPPSPPSTFSSSFPLLTLSPPLLLVSGLQSKVRHQMMSATDRHQPWVLAIYLCKDAIFCCCSCGPSIPLKGVQGENTTEVPCALGKTGRTGLQILRYFQKPIL